MSTKTNKTDWTATYTSDVYLGAPHPEDGERREALAFYVVCTNSFGDRYASKAFLSEDMGRVEAEERCRQFCFKVRNFLKQGYSPATSRKWTRSGAVYGSESYVAGGEEKKQIAREIKAECFAPEEESRLLLNAGCFA